MSVLIPAVSSLPDDTKTHLFNIPSTSQITGILPMYVHIYPDDLRLLDIALQDTMTPPHIPCSGSGRKPTPGVHQEVSAKLRSERVSSAAH